MLARNTKKMARIKLSKTDLEKHLKQQISFLVTSCQEYDQGKHHEAKRIATILRTLFHKTRSCKPLLGQLQIQRTQWVDTATAFDPQNLNSHLGLTRYEFTTGRLPCLVPKGSQEENNTLPFDAWWSRPVVVSVQEEDKKYYSRQNLVLNVAETDGGAHVDAGLDEIYYDLSRQNGLGINAIYKGEKYPLIYPELPCLRQIGHEVLLTLKRSKPAFFDEPYQDEIELIPFGMEIDDQDPNENIGIEIYFRKT
jgi:hypothetical protein